MTSENPTETSTIAETSEETSVNSKSETPIASLDSYYYERESIKCLAHVELSHSSIYLHPWFKFPEVKDPGLNNALWEEKLAVQYDTIGVERYIDLCEYLEIVPLHYIIESLPKNKLDLSYHGLKPAELRAVIETLLHNNRVNYLSLHENILQPETTKLLNELITTTHTIQKLDLSACKIGPAGAKNIKDGLLKTRTIKEINLSRNEIGDAGIGFLVEGFCDNTSIQKINLSYNNLDEDSLPPLALLLESNSKIKELDLSRNMLNHFENLKPFCKAIGSAEGLKNLNLSWNGIANKDCVSLVSKFIKENSSLETLDLSYNRITGKEMEFLMDALLVNKGLHEFRLGGNPLRGIDLEDFLEELPNYKVLKVLNLEYLWISKDSLPIIRSVRRKLKVQYQGVLSNHKIRGPDYQKVLLDRADYLISKKSKKKNPLPNMGQFLLDLTEVLVTKDDFEALLKKAKLKPIIKDRDLLKALAEEFIGLRKRVDLSAMLIKYMSLYPDTQPLPKKGKKKGKKTAVEEAITEEKKEGDEDKKDGDEKKEGDATKEGDEKKEGDGEKGDEAKDEGGEKKERDENNEKTEEQSGEKQPEGQNEEKQQDGEEKKDEQAKDDSNEADKPNESVAT